MMRMIRSGSLFFVVAIIVVIFMAGCVAPPKETTPAVTTAKTPTGGKTATPTGTQTHIYVTTVTPYVTPAVTGAAETTTSGYSEFVTQTLPPEEKSCRIYSMKQAFTYNGSAFTFNLKNPPMYINYTVVPQKVTEKKLVTYGYSNKTEYLLTYETYDPQAYLEIAVKDRETGEEYFKDGFGTKYTDYTTRTMKVLKSGDMLVEVKGNKVTATINFWAKPYGNFDNPQNLTFDACTYWGTTRDNLAYALITSTPTPTWTYKEEK